MVCFLINNLFRVDIRRVVQSRINIDESELSTLAAGCVVGYRSQEVPTEPQYISLKTFLLDIILSKRVSGLDSCVLYDLISFGQLNL